MLDVFIAIFLGIFFGTITGLIPGIHVNLVSVILVGLSGFLLGFTSPIILAVFIVSMAVTHTFLDSIAAIYLGAPDPDVALSVLPGHKLLLKGRGYEAVKLTIIGSLSSLVLAIILTYPLVLVIEKIYPILQNYIAYLLIIIIGFLTLREKKRFWAITLFILSGVLGLGVSSLNIENSLLPLLSGLFGLSGLFLSVNNKVMIPKQIITSSKVGKVKSIKAVGSSVFAGGLVSFLPGVGSSEAAIIASEMVGDIGDKAFLVLVGGINTVNFVLSFVSLYVLDKARNGAIVAVTKILDGFTLNNFVLFIGVALIAGSIATILALIISRLFSNWIARIKYNILCLGVITFVILLVFVFSSWLGLLVLFVSTMLGLIPPLVGCGRNHMMGCLILPIILFFLL